jgi:hypothetical protein
VVGGELLHAWHPGFDSLAMQILSVCSLQTTERIKKNREKNLFLKEYKQVRE